METAGVESLPAASAAGEALASDTPAAGGGTPPEETAAEAAEGQLGWMRVDDAKKEVHFDIVAGQTAENAAWNFNGKADGEMTITVPQGWTVTMTFTNQDGDIPHSLYFLAEGPPFPDELPDQSAIPRAYSINLRNGIGAGREDKLRFTVPRAGRFVMACGVFGHAKAGMWDWFVVSADAVQPSVEIAA